MSKSLPLLADVNESGTASNPFPGSTMPRCYLHVTGDLGPGGAVQLQVLATADISDDGMVTRNGGVWLIDATYRTAGLHEALLLPDETYRVCVVAGQPVNVSVSLARRSPKGTQRTRLQSIQARTGAAQP
jgi:hypothetical protein